MIKIRSVDFDRVCMCNPQMLSCECLGTDSMSNGGVHHRTRLRHRRGLIYSIERKDADRSIQLANEPASTARRTHKPYQDLTGPNSCEFHKTLKLYVDSVIIMVISMCYFSREHIALSL